MFADLKSVRLRIWIFFRSLEKAEHENGDDHMDGSEMSENKLGSRSKRTSRGSDYAMRAVAPERQLNPQLNVVRSFL